MRRSQPPEGGSRKVVPEHQTQEEPENTTQDRPWTRAGILQYVAAPGCGGPAQVQCRRWGRCGQCGRVTIWLTEAGDSVDE